jgi:hypothetical protein
MGPRKVFALGFALASLGGILWARGRKGRERVDLYFEDGSMVSLAGDSPEAALVLPYAREALRSVQ